MGITTCIGSFLRLTAKKPYCHSLFSKGRINYHTTLHKQYIWNPLKVQFARYCTSRMKLDTPEFHSVFTPELKQLIALFEKYKYELRIAGGAVRDLLLHKTPHDIDFATTATPDEMKTMFEKENIRMINTKGEKHGTVTCRLNDKENFEVTTLRIDVVTDGRHAEVEFTRDWEQDALRRDLTINSMFLGFDGTLYDFFQGREDLENRRVRFVGNPTARIQEDYLRILRYFRFFGRINESPYSHEAETLDAIRQNMHGLAGISGERIWVELKKILTGRHTGPLMKVMLELGMAQYIGITERPNIEEFFKVYEQCHDLNPLPMTLLPALMEEEKEVYALNERVKMSRAELQQGVFIINYRNYDFESEPLRHCQGLLCDLTGKEPKTKEKIIELLKYLNMRDTINQFEVWQLPKFPVSGILLLERGVQKGPKLAKTLSALRQKWKESGYSYTQEDLLEFVEEMKTSIK